MATKSFYQDILLKGNAALKLEDGDTNTISLVSPAALAADITLTLPSDDGNADELLSTDGSGNLDFIKIADANIDAAAAISLSKLAALTSNRAIVSDGSGVISVSAVTDTEIGYLDGVTSAIQTQLDAKLNLSGGTMSGAIAMGTNKITGLGDPTAAQDAVTKSYVDGLVNGLSWKQPVRIAPPGNINIAGTGAGTVDGVALSIDDRILLANQTDPIENGIYIVHASGPLTRSLDMDGGLEADGAAVWVQEGTNANQGFVQNNDAVTIGTDAQSWVQFSGTGSITGGDGIDVTGSTISVDLDTDAGLEFDTAKLQVKLDGSTLTRAAAGLKVSDLGINNAQIGTSAAIELSKLEALGLNFALVSDGSGVISASAVTATELGYLDGVTSAIQTQLDGKLNLTGGTMSGAIAMGSNKITGLADGTTTNDAVNFGQLDAKMDRFSADWATGDGTSKAVAHNFGSKDVIVQVYDKTDDSTIDVPAVRTDTNTVTLTSTEAPGASGWRVVVIG